MGFSKTYSNVFFHVTYLFLIKYRICEFKSTTYTKQNHIVLKQEISLVSSHFSVAYKLH